MSDKADQQTTTAGESSGFRPPSGLHPTIARLIEQLAAAAVRREDRLAKSAAANEESSP